MIASLFEVFIVLLLQHRSHVGPLIDCRLPHSSVIFQELLQGRKSRHFADVHFSVFTNSFCCCIAYNLAITILCTKATTIWF